MKKLLYTLLAVSMIFSACKKEEDDINNNSGNIVNIPDANFKAYLVGEPAINTNGDNQIQVTEASSFNGTIYCPYMSISNLTGIEAFTALTYLECSENQLTSLDVSQNTALTYLNCWDNQLTSLNVSGATALTELRCCNSSKETPLPIKKSLHKGKGFINQLTSLDVSQNTALTHLWCHSNQLTSLDVSQNTALTSLYCYSNQLTSLNVSQNTALTDLNCGWNQITSLDVSQNTALTDLSCDNTQLTSLDVSQNTALTYLNCRSNQLTSLDVRNGHNTNFTVFKAYYNPNLYCIDVDDDAFSTFNWSGSNFVFDPQHYFSNNCGSK